MKQKDVFLQSEGDAWLSRNAEALKARAFPEGDPLCVGLLGYLPNRELENKDILEIGCSQGSRLAFLRDRFGAHVHGVDPSAAAVAVARQNGVGARQGSADALPFGDGSFDIVMFGFCLYLCDREDLFAIAREADRVLRAPGWLAILDFYSERPVAVNYRHRPGVKSYKMDYRQLFDWNPRYHCMFHRVSDHETGKATDESDNWVAVSLLRKAAV